MYEFIATGLVLLGSVDLYLIYQHLMPIINYKVICNEMCISQNHEIHWLCLAACLLPFNKHM